MRIGDFLRRFSASPWSTVFVAVFSLLLSFGVSLWMGPRHPKVLDEFSYLTAADTFASGRLTNPTPPSPPHFATFHVLMHPTYASKYPPGQALFLALGKVLAGDFIVGAWIAVALACAATFWALKAWVGPRWALFGGCLVAAHPLVIGWANNFWGGGVAMLGGALLLGAVRRVASPSPRRRDAALGGIGIGLLAISRPAEGALLTLLCLATLAVWVYRKMQTDRAAFPVGQWLARLVAGASVPLILFVGFMLVYNRAVTGSPLTMPYVLYTREHDSLPLFRFQKDFPQHTYDNPVLKLFYDSEAQRERDDRSSIKKLGKVLIAALRYNTTFFLLCPIVLLGLFLALFQAGRRDGDFWLRAGLLGFVVVNVIVLSESYYAAHYLAPVLPLGLAVGLMALRNGLRARGAQWESNLRLPGSVKLIAAILLVSTAGMWAFSYKTLYTNRQGWQNDRAKIDADLSHNGSKNLVFVRYDLSWHDPTAEWVHNGADMQNAPVLWAFDLGADRNRELIQDYPDRRLWLLSVDRNQVATLTPYNNAPVPAGDTPKH